MFKQGDVDKWFKGFDKAFSNLDRSIDTAGENVEKHLKQRTNETTPTDTRALLRSRRFYQSLDESSFELVITYNEDGSAPYAIKQHELGIYNHDYEHNSTEVRSRSYQPLLYLYIPLVQEREDWWKKIFSRIRWK